MYKFVMFLAFLFTVNANFAQSVDSSRYVYPKAVVTDTIVIAAIVDKRLTLKELAAREKVMKTKLSYEYYFVVVESFIFPPESGKTGDTKVPSKQTLYNVNWTVLDPTKWLIIDIKEVK